jgi:HD superfamily phosphodiesterase
MQLPLTLQKKAERLVIPEYEKLKDWTHGWQHIENVQKISTIIANYEKQDSVFSSIIAYCHDLGRITEEKNSETEAVLGKSNHAIYSIGPTAEILEKLGLDGDYFNFAIEAIAVHSFKNYQGTNIYAKILRDADKGDALGPWGVLRNVYFWFKKDLLDYKEVLASKDNPEALFALAEQSLKTIKKTEEEAKKYNRLNDLLLEWFEQKMFDTQFAYTLYADEKLYLERIRKFLS